MAVITGIKEGVKIAQRLARNYKYLDINRKFIRKYVPPGYRRQFEVASDVLITGGLLYQAVNFGYNALQKPKRYAPNQFRQTRNYMVPSRSKSYRKYANRSCYRPATKRYKY